MYVGRDSWFDSRQMHALPVQIGTTLVGALDNRVSICITYVCCRVCMYVCVCVCVRVRVYVSMYVYVYKKICQKKLMKM